jgi:hypothetical protein
LSGVRKVSIFSLNFLKEPHALFFTSQIVRYFPVVFIVYGGFAQEKKSNKADIIENTP